MHAPDLLRSYLLASADPATVVVMRRLDQSTASDARHAEGGGFANFLSGGPLTPRALPRGAYYVFETFFNSR